VTPQSGLSRKRKAAKKTQIKLVHPYTVINLYAIDFVE